MDRMSDFWAQQSVWSQNTFGLDSKRGPHGPVFHLEREVSEAIELMDAHYGSNMVPIKRFQMELIDCFFLVIDAARRSGLKYEKFMDLVFEKLEINKKRNWPRVAGDENLPVEHDRTNENSKDLSCPASPKTPAE